MEEQEKVGEENMEEKEKAGEENLEEEEKEVHGAKDPASIAHERCEWAESKLAHLEAAYNTPTGRRGN
jgi:hypothetical protein